MKLLDHIKNFKIFEIGDFVVTSDETVCKVISLPKFKYRIKYTDGDFDDYYTDDFDSVRGNDWTIQGYRVYYVQEDNKLDWTTFHFMVQYELFDGVKHVNLIPKLNKLSMLLEKKELEEKISRIQ